MSYYITRIFNNKLKLGVILYIFIAPILDILLTLIDLSKGASVPAPYLATFLGGFSIGGLRKLLKWYLPLLLAIVVADDCIEDYRIGYKNILITKRGKNKYFALNMLKSFVISFLIIIIPLLLNLLMVYIVFAGGTYLFMDPESIKAIQVWRSIIATQCFITCFVFFCFRSPVALWEAVQRHLQWHFQTDLSFIR